MSTRVGHYDPKIINAENIFRAAHQILGETIFKHLSDYLE